MKPVVLCLEDQEEIAEEISDALDLGGFEPVMARSLEEFWSRTRERPVDLLLVDLHLPDGNGINVVRDVRKKSDVGIIIISAMGTDTDRIVGLEIGADDYLPKPFNPRELVARASTVLRRTRGQAFDLTGTAGTMTPSAAGVVSTGASGQMVSFGCYGVDLQARRVLDPHGEEVALTSAEFDLLVVFLQRRNRVLSRDQLIYALKGQEWEGYDRSIDSLVSRLRKKLSHSGEDAPRIRTVRNAGYMFVA